MRKRTLGYIGVLLVVGVLITSGTSGVIFGSVPYIIMEKAWKTNTGNTTIWSNSSFSRIEVNDNMDFNTLMAMNMTIDQGSTLPVSAVQGQWYLHKPTGRSVLMQYSTSWVPIYSFGTFAVYVDPVSGTDGQNYGTAVGASAFKTIQYAVDQIPPVNAGNVYINLSKGTYNEYVVIGGKGWTGNYNLYIYGVELSSAQNITYGTGATFKKGGASGTLVTPAFLNKTAGFSANYRGAFVRFNNTGDYFPIINSSADSMRVADNTRTTTLGAGSYGVYTPVCNMTYSGSNSMFTVRPAQTGVYVYYVKFYNTGTGPTIDCQANSGLTLTNCLIRGGNVASGSLLADCASVYWTRCSLYQSYSGKYLVQIKTQASLVGTGSFYYLNASGTILRMPTGSQYSGYSYFIGPAMGTGTGWTMLSSGAVIFGHYFESLSIPISADQGSSITMQSSNYINIVSCTYGLQKMVVAWGVNTGATSTSGGYWCNTTAGVWVNITTGNLTWGGTQGYMLFNGGILVGYRQAT